MNPIHKTWGYTVHQSTWVCHHAHSDWQLDNDEQELYDEDDEDDDDDSDTDDANDSVDDVSAPASCSVRLNTKLKSSFCVLPSGSSGSLRVKAILSWSQYSL